MTQRELIGVRKAKPLAEIKWFRMSKTIGLRAALLFGHITLKRETAGFCSGI